MKREVLLVLFCLFINSQVNGQKFEEEVVEECVHINEESPLFAAINRRNYSAGTLETVRGVPYLTNQYVSSVLNNNTDRNRMMVKYNLYTRNFETMVNGEVKVIPGNTIDSFEYTNKDEKKRVFINTRNFISESFQEEGFFEVLMEEKIGLYAFEDVTIKESVSKHEENQQKDYKYQKEKTYYLWNQNDLKAILSFNKKGLSVFAEKASIMKSYIKSNKLKFKRGEDVRKAILYYQTLI